MSRVGTKLAIPIDVTRGGSMITELPNKLSLSEPSEQLPGLRKGSSTTGYELSLLAKGI
jgi:hypothetical protein